jgi:hypothetical protein
MKSKRRAVGISLAAVAMAPLALWLTWDHVSGNASNSYSPPPPSRPQAAAPAETVDTAEPASGEKVDPQPSPRVDFSGKWEFDAEASDSLDPILEAIGISFIERALVNNAVVTHTITQTADDMTVEVKSGFFSRTDHLTFDGEPTATTDPTGRPVEATSHWSDDGKSLITKIFVKADKQDFTLTRSMDEAHDRMQVLVELLNNDSKTLSCRRVYKRINK